MKEKNSNNLFIYIMASIIIFAIMLCVSAYKYQVEVEDFCMEMGYDDYEYKSMTGTEHCVKYHHNENGTLGTRLEYSNDVSILIKQYRG